MTSHLLGIKDQPGKITYFIREDSVVCGTEEVKEIFKKGIVEAYYMGFKEEDIYEMIKSLLKELKGVEEDD